MNINRLISDLQDLSQRLDAQKAKADHQRNFGLAASIHQQIQVLAEAKHIARTASQLPIPGERPKDVDARVRLILQEALGVDEDELIGCARIKEDLGAESMDILDLRLRINNEFNIEVQDDQVDNCLTVEDLTAFLRDRVSVRA